MLHFINNEEESLSIKSSQENAQQKKFWGALLVIAGTTIGAGMLSLPMSVAALGILGGSALLVAMWFVMYVAALIAVDLNLHIGVGSSIAKLSNLYLGKIPGYIASIALVLMLNSLLVAYTSGASSLIQNLVTSHANITLNEHSIMIVFVILMSALVCIDMKVLDAGNRIFFAIMIGVFIAMMIVLFPKIHISSEMLPVQHTSFSPWFIAIPLFFTSFGFHGSIPSMVQYCKKQPLILKRAFFWGTLIPLLTYIVWMIGGLSIVYVNNPLVFELLVNGNADLGVFVSALSQVIDTNWLQSSSWIFSLLAIITSFLGVAIGLFDYYREHISITSPAKKRFISGFLALGVPLALTLIAEKTFLKVLGFAGIFLSIIAVGLPCLIWLRLGKQKLSSSLNQQLVMLILAVGICVIVCEIYNLCF